MTNKIDKKNSKILVTGGAGFIGSHIATALLKRGDEVAIIDHGKIAVAGAPAALRSQLKKDVISVEIAGFNEHEREKLATLEKAVSQLAIVQATTKDGARLKIDVESNEIALPQILERTASLSIPIRTITYSRPGLDEVFLHFTGRPLAEEKEKDA